MGAHSYCRLRWHFLPEILLLPFQWFTKCSVEPIMTQDSFSHRWNSCFTTRNHGCLAYFQITEKYRKWIRYRQSIVSYSHTVLFKIIHDLRTRWPNALSNFDRETQEHKQLASAILVPATLFSNQKLKNSIIATKYCSRWKKSVVDDQLKNYQHSS